MTFLDRESTVQNVDPLLLLFSRRKTVYLPYQFPFPLPAASLSCLAAAAIFILSSGETYLNRDLSIVVVVVVIFVVVIEFAELLLLLLLLLFWPLSLVHTRLGCGLVLVVVADDATDLAAAVAAAG